MIINKRCITAYATKKPYVALTSKAQLFDNSFSLACEIFLINYQTGKRHSKFMEDKFNNLIFAETKENTYLVGTQESGGVTIFRIEEDEEDPLVVERTLDFDCEGGELTCIDYLSYRETLCIGTSNGIINFIDLSNIDKRAKIKLGISGLTTILWSSKIYKIIVLGTSDGVIRLLDLRKRGIVTSLRSAEFSEVRAFSWDENANTRLLVQCEKNFIYYFDLSKGVEGKLVTLPADAGWILNFNNNQLFTSQGVTFFSASQTLFTVPFSQNITSCTISTGISMMSLERTDGTTEILPIPSVRQQKLFYRVESTIVRLSPVNQGDGSENFYFRMHKHRIALRETKEYADEDPQEINQQTKMKDIFYDELVSKYESSTKDEVISFLYDTARKSPSEEISKKFNPISVPDLSNPFVLSILNGEEIISGNSLKYKEKNLSEVPLVNILTSVVSNDSSVISKFSDFCIVFLLCKLFNNYGNLSRIADYRVLAGLCLRYDLDMSLLDDTTEGVIIHGIFCHDKSGILRNRIVITRNIYKNFYEIWRIMLKKDCQENEMIKSDLVCDYFWFYVSEGLFDKVKDINIDDEEILQYKQIRLSKNSENQKKELKSSLSSLTTNNNSRRIGTPNITGRIGTPNIQPRSAVVNKPSTPRMPSRFTGASQRQTISTPSTPKISNSMPSRSDIINKGNANPQKSVASSNIGHSTVIQAFDNLVARIKSKVATRNSILLRSRKNIALSSLSAYESSDKASLPQNAISAMEFLVERTKSIDPALVKDLDNLKMRCNIAWIHAIIELIKISLD